MNALLTTLVILLAAPAIRHAADAPAGLQRQPAQQRDIVIRSADAQAPAVHSEHGGNVATVVQSGSGNSSGITQSGGSHRAENDQSGDARFTVNQSGPPGEIVVRQNDR